MLLKFLNFCAPPFDAYAVFYAATTSVEFTLTITDTQNGMQKTYSNTLGNSAAPILDIQAFATCP